MSNFHKWRPRSILVTQRKRTRFSSFPTSRKTSKETRVVWHDRTSNSYLTFRTCFRRTSRLKSLRTWQPKLKNVQLFEKNPFWKYVKRPIWQKNAHDKNVAWRKERPSLAPIFCVLQNTSLLYTVVFLVNLPQYVTCHVFRWQLDMRRGPGLLHLIWISTDWFRVCTADKKRLHL